MVTRRRAVYDTTCCKPLLKKKDPNALALGPGAPRTTHISKQFFFFFKSKNLLLRRRALAVGAGDALRTKCDEIVNRPAVRDNAIYVVFLPEHVGAGNDALAYKRGLVACVAISSALVSSIVARSVIQTRVRPTCPGHRRASFSFFKRSNVQIQIFKRRIAPPARSLISPRDASRKTGSPTTYNAKKCCFHAACVPRTYICPFFMLGAVCHTFSREICDENCDKARQASACRDRSKNSGKKCRYTASKSTSVRFGSIAAACGNAGMQRRYR